MSYKNSLSKSPVTRAGLMGRVTGFEPATSRITISRVSSKINKVLQLSSSFRRRETAALRAAVTKLFELERQVFTYLKRQAVKAKPKGQAETWAERLRK